MRRDASLCYPDEFRKTQSRCTARRRRAHLRAGPASLAISGATLRTWVGKNTFVSTARRGAGSSARPLQTNWIGCVPQDTRR
jgi:hypothetical protein